MKRLWLFLICSLFILSLTKPSSAANFTVQNTNDSGSGSLRQAILNANATPGNDVIKFKIPGGGVKTITPLSELPWITDTVTIAGYTQNGQPKGPPVIELNGSSTNSARGLTLDHTNNSVIHGLIINRFYTGISIEGGSGNTIIFNYIGTDATGTMASPNYYGIFIWRSSNNLIGAGGKNIISGNDGFGIYISESNSDVVQNNYVGTDVTGTQTIPNLSGGIGLEHCTGTTIGTQNLISGNNQNGILIQLSTYTNVVGNYICTDKTGTQQLGYYQYGITVYRASHNRIGDITSGMGNVFACEYGNVGVVYDSVGNMIRGNSMFPMLFCTGISLSANCAVTTNDNGDGDTGANNLQNFPRLFDAVSDNGTTIVHGELSSGPSEEFIIDFYSNTVCSGRGHGVGKNYLASRVFYTDASGYAAFAYALPVSVPVGNIITATVTKLGEINDTSEFSNCVDVHFPD